MSKRDDDSQSDMEVGMTTAERRRRRRRGGGLRVPSDNVPRRSTTPPVVAPVPEDPALAMSIAYSFTSEASDAIPRTTRDTPVPSFENHEAMPTVIDPVSGPVEQADFEMATREMTAVDLEALGLAEAGISSSALAAHRSSSPAIVPITEKPAGAPGSEARSPKRDATDPVDDVDVEIDSGMDGMGDAGATLDQDAVEEDLEEEEAVEDGEEVEDATSDVAEVAEVAEMESPELSTHEPPALPPVTESSQARPPATDASQPRQSQSMTTAGASQVATAAPGFKPPRAQTVALSEDDLEEVREAARLATQPPVRSASTSTPPPMPPTRQSEIRAAVEPPRQSEIRAAVAEPPSVPEIDIMAL